MTSCHHREVVGALDRLDREAAVLLLGRSAVVEDDHAGDRVGALDVGDVEALDPARQARQVEGVGQLGHGGGHLHLVGEVLEPALLEVLGGALGDHLDQLPAARRAAGTTSSTLPPRRSRSQSSDDLALAVGQRVLDERS